MVFDTLLYCEGCLKKLSAPHLTASWRQPWGSYSFWLSGY